MATPFNKKKNNPVANHLKCTKQINVANHFWTSQNSADNNTTHWLTQTSGRG